MEPKMVINGMRVFVFPYEAWPVTNYVQRRTHRKKRINKKWRKRYGFDAVRDENVSYVFTNPGGGRDLIVSEKTYEKLKGESKT